MTISVFKTSHEKLLYTQYKLVNVYGGKHYLHHMIKRIPCSVTLIMSRSMIGRNHILERFSAADSKDSGKRSVVSSQYYHIYT